MKIKECAVPSFFFELSLPMLLLLNNQLLSSEIIFFINKYNIVSHLKIMRSHCYLMTKLIIYFNGVHRTPKCRNQATDVRRTNRSETRELRFFRKSFSSTSFCHWLSQFCLELRSCSQQKPSRCLALPLH